MSGLFITGVHKKLEAVGKKKGCEKVKLWSRSISNHMYWCAASSNGNGELVKAKWLSILNHVSNIHEGRMIVNVFSFWQSLSDLLSTSILEIKYHRTFMADTDYIAIIAVGYSPHLSVGLM